jgi:hypothetical protein
MSRRQTIHAHARRCLKPNVKGLTGPAGVGALAPTHAAPSMRMDCLPTPRRGHASAYSDWDGVFFKGEASLKYTIITPPNNLVGALAPTHAAPSMRMDCLPTGHVINDELTMSPSIHAHARRCMGRCQSSHPCRTRQSLHVGLQGVGEHCMNSQYPRRGCCSPTP